MNIPIFLSSDNNYAPFVATTMASILDNTKSFCEFYVLDSGISGENKVKICEHKKKFDNYKIEFISVNEDKLSSIEYKNDGLYVSKSTYNRFLISYLKPEILKYIYLDVDIIAIGDIKELFNQDLSIYVLGAVPDFGCPVDYLENVKKTIGFNLSNLYFNAGVLLVNNKKWQKENIQHKLFEIENQKRNVLCMADQDVLNLCFENNYKILDEKFNVVRPSKNIVLRHFAGGIKPWQADFTMENKKPIKMQNVDLFWKYAKMTPFYDRIFKTKEDFLNSNILYKRFNKMVTERVK